MKRSKIPQKLMTVVMTASVLFLTSCGGSDPEPEIDGNDNLLVTEDVTNSGTDVLDESLASTLSDASSPRSIGGDKDVNQSFIDDMFPLEDNTVDQILGCYVGGFGKNKINLTIYETKNGNAEGYSVCAGNFRKVTGTFDLMEEDHYTFSLKEPGDDQYDGIFEFNLDASDEMVKGSWTPYKEKGNSAKTYELKKRKFEYKTDLGTYPEASQRVLTDDDLNNLGEYELTEMRNEIYARHGYCFKNKEWRSVFEGYDWYMPMGTDIRGKLTDVEVENIELIYEYESYLEEYYDGFGR
ncbi:MAG: YARHG domain-containing protein [Crocinitomix sp.]|nr:YARHG domain-containing protein [Crocinitomix sp.]